MALTFPRDMVSAQCWETAKFTLQRRQELSRTADGRTQGKDLGPAIWRAEFQTYPLAQADAEALEADLMTLQGVVNSFYAVTMRRRAPLTWASNTLAGVTVLAIGASNDKISLAGLPAGFVMTAGDFVTITTSSGTELHKLARGGTADGNGQTPKMEVVPHIRPGVAAGDAVTLIDPFAEMVMEPGSLDMPRQSLRRWRVGFKAVQVLS